MIRLTLEQAAAELGKKVRWLKEWLREHPLDQWGQAYFTPIGRSQLFQPHDIDRLRAAFEELDRRETFLYFVEMAGHVKIGIARDWKKRLASMQTGSPLPIRRLLIIKTAACMEAILHTKFAAHRIRGEWFRDCPEIREFIAKAADSPLMVVGAEGEEGGR